MKFYYIFFLLLSSNMVLTQNLIVNGDFENNSSNVQCNTNLSDAAFTNFMDNVTGFGGDRSELDILEAGCFSADPQSGTYKIAFSAIVNIGSCNIAFDLSNPIVSGEEYEISFYFNPSSEFERAQGEIIVGLSADNMSFGTEVFRGGGMVSVSDDTWTEISGTFVAPSNANYLTVAGESSGNMWAHLDNFSLTQVTAPPSGVPTLSQWGLIILGLGFLIFGTVALKQRNKSLIATNY